ncbi:MAG: galactitol-1-phosphate 5-dehydrogenase [Opitutae bacterium]|nr:galactitol-1-phosphate 5-dehydrogenase [Opitutae bacterium]
MRALFLTAPSELRLEDVPVPVPPADEILLRVRACGICGSDVHGLDGSTKRRIPPLIMGHEAAGEVAGPGHPDWPAGTPVTFDSTAFCGGCWHCRRGEVNLCDRREVVGVSCADYRRHGAFAEYVSVPVRTLYRLPAGLDYERAALVEPVAVALHAVNRAGLVASDTTAVVVGTGLIGLLVVQALRIRGCRRIVAVDLDAGRLALAARFGATTAVDARTDDAAARVRDLTAGRGADSAFEVVGATGTINTAIACTRKGGEVVLVGNLASQVSLPLQLVVTRELRLIGTCACAGEYPASLELIASGQMKVDELISARPPLVEGPEWCRRLQAGEAGLMKVVLCP